MAGRTLQHDSSDLVRLRHRGWATARHCWSSVVLTLAMLPAMNVLTPRVNGSFPCHFPTWLQQVQGIVANLPRTIGATAAKVQ